MCPHVTTTEFTGKLITIRTKRPSKRSPLRWRAYSNRSMESVWQT